MSIKCNSLLGFSEYPCVLALILSSTQPLFILVEKLANPPVTFVTVLKVKELIS